MIAGRGYVDRYLEEDEVRELVGEAFSGSSLEGKRVIVIIPDGTRTAPISMMFRSLREMLGERVAALDYLIALGTHQPMSEEAIDDVGRGVGRGAGGEVSTQPWSSTISGTIRRHSSKLGGIPEEEVVQISDGLLKESVRVIGSIG
jgi:hypothetical protein